jgi:hypothetical protein
VPIFVIFEDPHNVDHITPHKPKKWENIQNNLFLILNKQHTIAVAKVC